VPASREDLLRGVALGTAGTTGDDFLHALSELLGSAYGLCWLTELVDDGATSRPLAAVPADSLPAGLLYPVAGTPIDAIAAGTEVLYETGIHAAYPGDPFLCAQEIEGYVGLPARDTDGAVVGVLEVAAAGSLSPGDEELVALRLCSSWVGSTIERHRRQAALRARETELLASRVRVVEAADQERRRIGRDLHDGVQQRVLALNMLMNEAYESLDGSSPGVAELLRDALDEAAGVGAELRDLARGLHPSGLTEQGLELTLEQLARRAPVPLDVRSLPDRRLPPPVELTVYYLVAEALTNTAKHGDGSGLRVDVELGARALRVVTADAGPGGAALDAGGGLRGLRDRVAALGGTLEVASPPGAGTTLTADIPLAPFRDARDPYIEYGYEGDGGEGLAKIQRILDGEQRLSVSLAAEWELEGGPPRIGQELALRDHTSRRHGTVRVTQVALMPLSLIDADTARQVAGRDVTLDQWRAELRRFWEDGRDDMAVLLGQPDWRLTDDTPMVVLWFELVR
jgi:signal transduction histidine kinase/uncharacterized protein YhfF